MFFDLINVSAIFQVYINHAITELLDIICIVYLNDILIYFYDSKKHAKHVQMILKHLKVFRLYVKLSKCQFNFTKISFLSFHISTDDVSIVTIINWLISKFFNKMQVFLKFANFYCWFIKNYSQVIHYLTNLLKNFIKRWKTESFQWNKRVKKIF